MTPGCSSADSSPTGTGVTHWGGETAAGGDGSGRDGGADGERPGLPDGVERLCSTSNCVGPIELGPGVGAVASSSADSSPTGVTHCWGGETAAGGDGSGRDGGADGERPDGEERLSSNSATAAASALSISFATPSLASIRTFAIRSVRRWAVSAILSWRTPFSRSQSSAAEGSGNGGGGRLLPWSGRTQRSHASAFESAFRQPGPPRARRLWL